MIEAARLGFDPFIPLTLLWVTIGICVLVWAIYLFKRGRAWLMRAAGLALLTLGLSNPLWVQEQREPLKEIVALVRDKSESMRFAGRAQAADTAFEALKEQLEQDDSVELRIAETDAGAQGTNVYSALQSALSDAPRDRIAGSLIISDGRIHDLPEDSSEASALGPIHGLIVGETDEFDRRVEIVSSPNFNIVGDMAQIIVRVDDTRQNTVRLNLSINGERLPSREVPTGTDVPISIDIERRGSNLIVAEVPAADEELTIANNRTAVNVLGVRDRLRVLLVTGEPHPGARLWRDLLKADPSVDLVHFTILRPPRKEDRVPLDELALISFPTRELFVDKLDEFDLVVFDRYQRINVLPMAYFDRISRYVADGGALLVGVGPSYAETYSIYRTPLAAVLPVRPTGRIEEKRTNISRTELGHKHTVTANLMDENGWGPWHRYIGGRAMSGETVLEAEDKSPLLVLDRVGKGRVATLMSDQLWLWARSHEGGGPYDELIRRTVHWLMKEPELEEELLSLTAEGSNLQARLRTLSDKPQAIEVVDPDGDRVTADWQEVGPGVFETEVAGSKLGLFSARAGRLTTVALNGPANPQEYVDVRSTTEILRPLSEETDGNVYRIGTGDRINLPSLRWVAANANAAGDGWAWAEKKRGLCSPGFRGDTAFTWGDWGSAASADHASGLET